MYVGKNHFGRIDVNVNQNRDEIFVEQLKLDFDNIHKDVASANIYVTSYKAGDFGCGDGISPIALMNVINLGKAVGTYGGFCNHAGTKAFPESKKEIRSCKL